MPNQEHKVVDRLFWKVKAALIPDPLDVTEMQKVIVKKELCKLC